MAKNKNMQNPEAENLRREDADTVEMVSLEDLADTDTKENEEVSLEELLLKTEEEAEEPEEISFDDILLTESANTADELLEKDFGESLADLAEETEPAADTEEEKEDITAFAPPPEEEPTEKKGLLAGLFARKAVQTLQEETPEDVQEAAEEPVMNTDELSFVTDSIPAVAAVGAAGMAENAEAAGEDVSAEAEDADEPAADGEEPKSEKAKPAGPAKMVVTLTVICGVVALLLSAVNAVTADVIAENAVKKQSEAILRIFTDGTDVVPYGDGGDTWLVYRDDVVLGYCAAVAPMGYVDEISMMVGVDTADRIVGVQIVEMGETSGIGTKTRSDSFLGQYAGQNGPFTVGDNVDGIVGATYSSEAVTEGVNMALA
ncbi:MAG: FMN-binding protein, partial [Clostridia bacterium]|nr:FMN-binding protein [Clostridia bacterium]